MESDHHHVAFGVNHTVLPDKLALDAIGRRLSIEEATGGPEGKNGKHAKEHRE